MAKKYISKYTGPEIDSGLDNIPKLEGKLTELESKREDLTDTMVNGGFLMTGKLGNLLSVSIYDDGNFRRAKIPVSIGETYRLTGVGGGKEYVSSGQVTEDLTSSAANGYYTYSSTNVGEATTPTRNYNGAWRCIEQPVKAGDKITLSGTGGGGARLYCLVNSNNIIKAIAGSDETQTGLVINVEEDGTLYCSFNNSNTYSLIREYTIISIDGGNSDTWKNGSYSFGKTCDMDYTAPNITPYSFPETGKVAAVYGYYDALVAKYPAYVNKIDCDDAMSSLGIEKPASIADLPMYMYRFAPPKAPNSTAFGATDSSANMIKALILTGTHNEYIAVWDCYNAMRLICEEWQGDKNLEELRWNAEIYIIPCYNLYGVENSTRTNENGVDLNRNAPTSGWEVQGALGDNTYSGSSAGSEYSTQVMLHYFRELNPQIFIDHHNTNVGAGTSVGDGKNMIYVHSLNQICIDFTSVLISQMTRKWKLRYTDTFPSIENDPTTLFGYVLTDNITGSIGRYGSENGALGSTYESNFGILYKNGEFSTDNRQTNTEVVTTCAVEGFVNYLLRSFGAYSDYVGINKLVA